MHQKYKITLLGFKDGVAQTFAQWLKSLKDFEILENSLELLPDVVLLDFTNNPIIPENLRDLPSVAIGQASENENIIFLNKPIRFNQLEQALRGIIRARDSAKMAQLKIGEYDFIPHKKAFCFGENEIKLTDKEIAMLVYLNEKKGQKISREELLREVWFYNEGVSTHTLETHIYRLRQKLSGLSASENILQTEEGGYSLNI